MTSENLDEKYKPTTIAELVGQPKVQATMKELLQQKNIVLPHMIFTGPPGVGKTSTAVALAKDLYGSEWRSNLHIYNASDSRGIDFIRGTIKQLTMVQPVSAAFQIIFLDEADELTSQAQDSLKQIMQQFTETTKFIFACNNQDKIIQPIKDRCSVFSFTRIPEDLIVQRLKLVCGKEGITYDEGTLEILAQRANGSLRQAIISIATSCNRHNHIELGSINDEIVYLDELSVKKIITDALEGSVKDAEKQFLDLYYENNEKHGKIFELILNEVDKMKLDPSLKQAIINETGRYDYRMCDPNATRNVQMKCYLNALSMIGAKK